MKPTEVKSEAKRAVDTGNTRLAIEVCRAVASEEVFVGRRAPTDTAYEGDLTRPLSHAGRCNECGIPIPRGTVAVWIKGAGVWHIACYKES